MKKPKKVLCKRSLIIGDNRMLTSGIWYDVVYNKNDTDKTFSVIDNDGRLHLHYMYSEGDKKDWPDFCKNYGPRDYAKWFYTLGELRKYKIDAICTKLKL